MSGVIHIGIISFSLATRRQVESASDFLAGKVPKDLISQALISRDSPARHCGPHAPGSTNNYPLLAQPNTEVLKGCPPKTTVH